MSLIMKNVKEENPMTSWQGTFMSANISSLMTRAVKRRRVCFFYIQKEHVPPEDKTSCPKNHYATDQAVLTEVTWVITLFGNAWLDDGTLKNHLHVKHFVKSLADWLIDSKPQAHGVTGCPVDINSHRREFDKSVTFAANKKVEVAISIVEW